MIAITLLGLLAMVLAIHADKRHRADLAELHEELDEASREAGAVYDRAYSHGQSKGHQDGYREALEVVSEMDVTRQRGELEIVS